MTTFLEQPATTPAGSGRRHTEEIRRGELAGFLRSRRERISPEQVGLPPGGRRRTPGLRREEVAQLAGVGVTWYTWLEQGRDIKASEHVLQSIATTLRLDPYERAHLFTLAGLPEPAVERECRSISPQIHVLLRQMEPYPVVVQNARFDLLAYNRGYARLNSGIVDNLPFEDRNSLLQLFTNPDWRAPLAQDWDDIAPRVVAQFRAAMAQHVAESSWKCLVKRLREESAEFAALWNHHDVSVPENKTKRYLHPAVGLLRLDYTHLWFGPRSETRLTTYTPADEDTERRVHALSQLVPAVG
ncbi:MAG TPA: helix-turn-helix transcriptional regulator [Pseudonocardiaceae bacterium]|jgi:transcriptional regulator with XRE-family HTH domain|nr:helix-turn-helix transcriptional regulator [Pseudonocardiaceae bacterium]